MMDTIESKTNEFTVNKAIIRHLISSQAGSLNKAIEELISNSWDAKATKVDVSITQTHIDVIDDGPGFKSVDEIESLFGDFGFDHETEEQLAKERNVGRFGLGRGQALNFMRTVWESNTFSMHVDLKDQTDTAAYELKTHPTSLHSGCKVSGELYEPLSIVELHNTIKELEKNLKYVIGIDININGKRINKADALKKFDVETDDFYFKVTDNDNGVQLYNRGVYVERLWQFRVGVSGTLVSKKALKLNMARNSWLQAEDPLYKVGMSLLRSAQAKKPTTRFNNGDRHYAIRQLMAGETQDESEQVWTLNLIRGVNGKLYSIKQLVSQFKCICVADEDRTQAGENLIKDKIAFCFSPSSLQMFGVHTVEGFIEAFKELFTLFSERNRLAGMRWASTEMSYSKQIASLDAGNYKDLVKQYSSEYLTVTTKDASPKEQVALWAVQYSNVLEAIRRAVSIALDNKRVSKRKLLLGSSDLACGWTNGKDTIWLDKRFLTKELNKGVRGAEKVVKVLLHEQCHLEEESNQDHLHGLEFYELFHDALDRIDVATLAIDITKRYVHQSMKKELGTPVTAASSLEQIHKHTSIIME